MAKMFFFRLASPVETGVGSPGTLARDATGPRQAALAEDL